MTTGDLPAWMTPKAERKKINARSRKQEREHAEEEGGRVQAGSGSSWRAPEDVVTPRTLDQLKFTDAGGYRVSADELQRILANAERRDLTGRLIIEFSGFGIRLVGDIERIQPGKRT